MSTVFEVTGPIPDGADRVIAAGVATLWRTGDRVHLAIGGPPAAVLRDASLAGLSLRPSSDPTPERPPGSGEAHGRDLRPIRCPVGTIDRLDVRRVPLAAATDRLLQRGPLWSPSWSRRWPLSPRRREQCRDLLHGRDGAYVVTRIVWCPRTELREARHSRSLRPVVFARGSGPPALERTVRAGELAAWIRG